jgi:hypothetical protein
VVDARIRSCFGSIVPERRNSKTQDFAGRDFRERYQLRGEDRQSWQFHEKGRHVSLTATETFRKHRDDYLYCSKYQITRSPIAEDLGKRIGGVVSEPTIVE